MVIVNGEEKNLDGQTVEEFLEKTDLIISRIAVELNGSIVGKARYGEVRLKDGDHLEVVSFVGGG